MPTVLHHGYPAMFDACNGRSSIPHAAFAERDPQVHLVSTHQPAETPVCVAQRQPGVQYFVEHHGSHLFIMTNASLEEFVKGSQHAGTPAPDAHTSAAAGRASATAYQAAPGDRAEDISFSRWSSADWESAEGSPQTGSSPPKALPRLVYHEGAADRAEDISFSRWSPLNWESEASPAIGSNGSNREQRQAPASSAYRAGPADRAEDISFSRWSPASYQTDDSDLPGTDAAEFRLLRVPVMDGLPSR